MKYPKIQSIFKRDHKGNFIDNQFSLPEFEYLENNLWVWTEKIDGMNIRIYWDCQNQTVKFMGRNDNADIPKDLIVRLEELFPVEKFRKLFPETSMTLYGEGFGAGIQKAGSKYSAKKNFILFDIMINDFWLLYDSILDIGNTLNVLIVPKIINGTIKEAIEFVRSGFNSSFGKFHAEGLVGTPVVSLYQRNGDRIIVKIKCQDFKV